MTTRQWLGRVLRLLRVQHGLTLGDTSRRSGIPLVRLSEIERGWGEPATSDEVGALLRLLLG